MTTKDFAAFSFLDGLSLKLTNPSRPNFPNDYVGGGDFSETNLRLRLLCRGIINRSCCCIRTQAYNDHLREFRRWDNRKPNAH